MQLECRLLYSPVVLCSSSTSPASSPPLGIPPKSPTHSFPPVREKVLWVATVIIIQKDKQVGDQWYIHTWESHGSKSHPTQSTLDSAEDACPGQAVINALFRNINKTKTHPVWKYTPHQTHPHPNLPLKQAMIIFVIIMWYPSLKKKKKKIKLYDFYITLLWM